MLATATSMSPSRDTKLSKAHNAMPVNPLPAQRSASGSPRLTAPLRDDPFAPVLTKVKVSSSGLLSALTYTCIISSMHIMAQFVCLLTSHLPRHVVFAECPVQGRPVSAYDVLVHGASTRRVCDACIKCCCEHDTIRQHGCAICCRLV